ncbi:MAG: family 10 glycosylhydrolase [Planctomycetes bacterium]|nr:family 10 glycosylhydrolase [Planctomycetota bacterium]
MNRNWLLARRAPGDQIRVSIGRPSLVFASGEKLRLDVEPHLLGLPKGTKLRVRSVLRKHGSTKELWEQKSTVRSVAPDEVPESITVERELPSAEGVYDLVVTAERRNAIRLWQSVAKRTVQLIVLESRPRRRATLPGASPPTKLLQEIDPTDNGWWRGFGKLPDVSKFPGLAKDPPNNGDASFVKHPALGKMVELGPPSAKAGMSWRAYPLRLDAPGQPHILEIVYPSDAPLKLGVSLIEPNAAGKVTPIGVDSAVHQRSALAGPARMLKHRMIIWPRTKSPWVLLTNQSESEVARFGKIRLYGPKSVTSTFRLTSSAVGYLPRMEPLGARPTTRAQRQRNRLLAGFYDKPLFGENFSAAEVFDEPSGRSLDDWNTFYQGGSRLVEYLGHVGYNALVLSVLADGATIYPSEILQPTPKYDTGVFFANGQDPQRKDVLEMLLRLFDRNDLRLIPSLQFSTPLPELEARLRAQRFGHDGVELIGGDGRPYLASHRPHEGRGPYYNPLSPYVQEAMLRVVNELVQRYGDHPSLGGVSIQLSTDGFAQLPAAAWGLDDVTFGRFENDEKVDLGRQREDRFAARARYVRSVVGRRKWLAWRAKQMHAFYSQVQRLLPPGVKLYLAGANMFDDPQLRGRLAPTLPRRMKLDDALLEIGIDCTLYQGQDKIVLLRGQWNSADGSDLRRAVDRAVNQSTRIDAKIARLDLSGSLIHTLPRRIRLESFDAKGPFGREATFTWLVAQPSASGAEHRRQFEHERRRGGEHGRNEQGGRGDRIAPALDGDRAARARRCGGAAARWREAGGAWD